MDIFYELGELALGSRLRRLSDTIMRNGSQIYLQNNIDFEPKYFTIYYLLLKNKGLGIMEISEKLGLAHPSVVQLINEMEEKKLVLSTKDQNDKRKRALSLSEKATKMAPQLTQLWDDIATAIHGLLAEYDINFINKIASIENQLKIEPLSSRVAKITTKRKMNAVNIIAFEAAYADKFREINYGWIKKYFRIENPDKEVLENPKSKIIDKGGHILFAEVDGIIAGTCALVNLGNDHYELSKMGVQEQYQGKQIGKKLGVAIIEKARSIGAKKISLDTNKKLKAAIGLYERLGFVPVNRTDAESLYQRSNVYMELELDQ